MSIGLELGGWVSPLKYLTEPFENLVMKKQDWNTHEEAVILDTKYEMNSTSPKEISENEHINPKWSILTFVLMFAPGLLVGLYAFLTKGLKAVQNCPLYECPHWFQMTLLFFCILMTFCFPLGILSIQTFELVIVIITYKGLSQKGLSYIKEDKMLMTLKHITEMTMVVEAFFESGPQIVLQIYIICATREITATQAVSIMISLIMIAKTTIIYDMMYNETGTGNRTIGQTAKYLLAILPLYASSVIFKAGSIALFCIFLGFYTAVVITILFLVLLLITQRMGFNFSDGLILSLMNLIVVSNKNTVILFE